MEIPTWARQSGYSARFDWGPSGVAAMDGAATIVVVDVLRFSTAVCGGVGRGLTIHPYRWGSDGAAALAGSIGAVVADGRPPEGVSLSPASLLRLEPGSSVVLPSPNGASCALVAAEAGATVAAACLRNAGAVARWAAARPGEVAVIAAGERWPDGSLRPAVEDLLGAGAVLAALPGALSPEAQAAVAAFHAAADRLADILRGSTSGRELHGRGQAEDVAYASELDADVVVPVLRDGAFRA